MGIFDIAASVVLRDEGALNTLMAVADAGQRVTSALSAVGSTYTAASGLLGRTPPSGLSDALKTAQSLSSALSLLGQGGQALQGFAENFVSIDAKVKILRDSLAKTNAEIAKMTAAGSTPPAQKIGIRDKQMEALKAAEEQRASILPEIPMTIKLSAAKKELAMLEADIRAHDFSLLKETDLQRWGQLRNVVASTEASLHAVSTAMPDSLAGQIKVLTDEYNRVLRTLSSTPKGMLKAEDVRYAQQVRTELEIAKATLRSGSVGQGFGGFFSSIKEGGKDLLQTMNNAANLVNSVQQIYLQTTFMLRQMFSGVSELIKLGAEVRQTEDSFYAVAESADVAGDTIVAGMNRAARGTMDDTDMMSMATRTLLSGGKDVANQLPALLESARTQARLTGADTSNTFNVMTRAIARVRPTALASINLFIDAQKVYKDYGLEVGKSASELSKLEKRIALTNAVIAQTSPLMKAVGTDTMNTRDQIASLPVAWQNLKEAVGKGLEGVGVTRTMTDFAAFLRQMTDLGPKMREARSLVQEIAKGTPEGANQLQAATSFVRPRIVINPHVIVEDSSRRILEEELNTIADSLATAQRPKRKLSAFLIDPGATKEQDAALLKARADFMEKYYEMPAGAKVGTLLEGAATELRALLAAGKDGGEARDSLMAFYGVVSRGSGTIQYASTRLDEYQRQLEALEVAYKADEAAGMDALSLELKYAESYTRLSGEIKSYIEQSEQRTEWVRDHRQAIQEADDATAAFSTALQQVEDSGIGAYAAASKLGTALGQIRVVAAQMPEAPTMGKEVLALDAAAWARYARAYETYLEKTGDLDAGAKDRIKTMREEIAALSQQQKVILDTARVKADSLRPEPGSTQMGSLIAASNDVARALLGEKATVVDLQKNYDSLTGAVKAFYDEHNGDLIAFNANLRDTTDAQRLFRSGIIELQGTALELAKLNVSDTVIAKKPEMPKGIASETQSMRAWAESLRDVDTRYSVYVDSVITSLNALDRQRAAVLASAAAMSDGAVAAQYLNREFMLNASSANTYLAVLLDLVKLNASGALESYRPPMPTGIGSDTTALREWVATARAAGGETAQYGSLIAAQLSVIDGHRAAVLSQAAAMTDSGAAVKYLSREFNLGEGSIDSFLSSVGNLTPEMQAQLPAFQIMSAAIARLRAQASAGVSLSVRVQGIQAAFGSVQGMASRLVGAMPMSSINDFVSKAQAAYTQLYMQRGKITELELEMQKTALDREVENYVSKHEQAFQTVTDSSKKANSKMLEDAGSVRSRIESTLSNATVVTSKQMRDAEAGKYTETSMEAARQLDDIAQHGREALGRHKDWIAKYGIGPELLAPSEQSEKDLKAWAATFRDQVKGLERPDLINWDAFVGEYKASLDREGAKGLTMSIAVQKLDEAGLLKGKTQAEKEKEAAKALGLDAPIPFDVRFNSEPNADLALAKQILGDKDALEINIKPKWMVGQTDIPPMQPPLGTLDQMSIPLPTTTITGKQSDIYGIRTTPNMFPTQQTNMGLPNVPVSKGMLDNAGPQVQTISMTQNLISDTDLQKQGTANWTTLKTAITDAAAVDGLSTSLSAIWTDEFNKNADLYKGAGHVAGVAIGNGVGDGVKESVGNLRKTIAAIIAPEVAEILERKQKPSAIE
jgi:hypothetical protein